MRVAFIGLGNMGRPMALNVLGAGHKLVVWNRTRDRAAGLLERGAALAGSPAEAARNAEVVLACLADVPASRWLFLGEGGLVEAARPGQVLADHGTVDLETTRAVHQAARGRGCHFLDAPVSGGPSGAAEATLSIMVGGEPAAFERARPVLEAMGKTVVLLGGAGAGTAAKLANQLLVGVHTLAACEALALARRAGVDLERLLPVLERSWGQSRMLERNGPRIIRRDFGPSGAPLRNLLKDLTIIEALGQSLGIPVAAAEAARGLVAALAAEGKELWDVSACALAVDRSEEAR